MFALPFLPQLRGAENIGLEHCPYPFVFPNNTESGTRL